MSGLAKKRKREEEMEGENADLATENALMKAEINKLKLENKSLQESEANEKVKVEELEGRKKDLLAEISHIKGQKTKDEVNKGEASGLGKDKDDSTPVFHFAIPQKVAEELNGKSIKKVQGKTDHGKASEVNAAGILFLGAGRADDDLQKTSTSSEVKANDQDEVVIIEETVEEGKVTIPHEELMKYKKAAEEVKNYKQVLEELQMLVECPVCMTTPKEGPMPSCPAGHLTCAPCLEVMRKKGKKMCPSCRGPLGKGKSLLSSAIIKTVEVKDSGEEQSSPQPGGSQMPGPSNSVLSSPGPKSKVFKAIKGRVLTPGKQSPKVGKGSPVLVKKKLSIGGANVGNLSGAAARFEGTCPLCGKKFMDAVQLETHASECNGGSEQNVGASIAGGWPGLAEVIQADASDDSDD